MIENPDPESLLDSLVEGGVLAVDEGTDAVTTTDSFEDTRALYHDIYVEVSGTEFEETVASLFGLSREDARRVIEEGDVTRGDVTAYLALRSHLDADPPSETLARMAAVVAEIGPGSMVPDEVHEVGDESYGEFLAAHPDAVVTVWKRGCDPCEAVKDELDAILDRIPDGVAVAGIEHVPPSAFRREFRVDAAPAFLLFRGGEVAERFEGRTDPATLGAAFDAVYTRD